jgi:hypothetical protein
MRARHSLPQKLATWHLVATARRDDLALARLCAQQGQGTRMGFCIVRLLRDPREEVCGLLRRSGQFPGHTLDEKDPTRNV